MADSTAWVAFGSALAGATVGGLASSAGSLAVSRRRAAFDARTVLYLDLIADFRPSRSRPVLNSPGPFPDGILESMRRTAILAGRRDRRLVGALQSAWDDYQQEPPADDPRWEPMHNTQTGEPLPGRRTIKRDWENAAIEAALVALEQHLEKKLG
jgi:hypothetical protein